MIKFDAIRLSGLTDIDLPMIGASSKEPFQVAAIDGLGPSELDVVLAEVQAPGGIFVNRRAKGREIVLRIGLNPDFKTGQTVSDLRYKIYGLLSPGVNIAENPVIFSLLKNNVPVLETRGYVKRVEIVPFDKKPQIQVTMPCLEPYLNVPDITDITSQIPPSMPTWTLTNEGLAPTGIQFKIRFLNEVTNFSIGVENGDQMLFQAPNGAFEVGDELTVDTSESKRTVNVVRAGTNVFFLEILSPDSNWIVLNGGEHTIQTSSPFDFEWLYFRYVTRYWGI